ncbi:HNH endonuclease signature motif containing protein [Paenibacillus lutimineralis]
MRGSAAARGYDGKWRKERAKFLKENPLCKHCYDEGELLEATVVDHIVPHKGDKKLFWNKKNWQPLCKRHHDSKTVREDGGFGRSLESK